MMASSCPPRICSSWPTMACAGPAAIWRCATAGQGQAGRSVASCRPTALDLAALAQIASRLPLGDTVHGAVRDYAPRGLVAAAAGRMARAASAAPEYQVRAKVAGLALAADQAVPTVAGLSGAQVSFDLTQAGGQAELAMADGTLRCPACLRSPWCPCSGWKRGCAGRSRGERIAVQTSQLRFANADAQGEARLSWHTGDACGVACARALSGSAGPFGHAVAGRWHARASLPAAHRASGVAALCARRHPCGDRQPRCSSA